MLKLSAALKSLGILDFLWQFHRWGVGGSCHVEELLPWHTTHHLAPNQQCYSYAAATSWNVQGLEEHAYLCLLPSLVLA